MDSKEAGKCFPPGRVACMMIWKKNAIIEDTYYKEIYYLMGREKGGDALSRYLKELSITASEARIFINGLLHFILRRLREI